MLKNTTVTTILLLVSIATYYIYDHYTIPTAEPAGNVVFIAWGALAVSLITFVLAIVGLVQKAKDKTVKR